MLSQGCTSLATTLLQYVTLFVGLSKFDNIPHELKPMLLEKFTEQGANNARSFNARMKDKLLSYLFVLVLMVNNYSLTTDSLQNDISIQAFKYVLSSHYCYYCIYCSGFNSRAWAGACSVS